MPYIDSGFDAHVALQSRDIDSDTFAPNETQRTTLIVSGCYIIAIAILWHVEYIKEVLYPFKLLTIAIHEFSHAIAGILTCAKIGDIHLDPDEGGVTRISGGISVITLPAGYIGSSFIGACLIACGFDTNASKVATLVISAIFLLSLQWARRDALSWVLILFMSGLILAFWFIGQGVALRYLVLFIGVMSCMYVLWDTIGDIIEDTIEDKIEDTGKDTGKDTSKDAGKDTGKDTGKDAGKDAGKDTSKDAGKDTSKDTIRKKKVNKGDAFRFAEEYGCCPQHVWGIIWLIIAFIFFAAGVLVGLAVFKRSAVQQVESSRTFLATA